MKIKKSEKGIALALVLCIVFTLCLSSCGGAMADMYYTDGMLFGYRAELGGYVLLRYYGSGHTVTVPATVNGSPVVKLGARAFFDCENVECVTLPDTLNFIDNNAFSGCKSLRELTLPFIGETPDADKYPNNRFFYIFGLAYAIPDTLETVRITKQTEFPENAFVMANNVKEIILPETVTQLPYGMFFACGSLENVSLPSGITSVSHSCFSGCGITHITLPQGTRTISTQGFSGCTDLITVDIPEGLTHIGDRAFAECEGMQYLVLPTSLHLIGREAFRSCSGLEHIFYKGSPEQWEGVYVDPMDNEYLFAALCYYSESAPTDTEHTYWHFSNGVPTPW